METGIFSVLNYSDEVFSQIAPECSVVQIQEIQKGLGSIDYLEGFTEHLIDQILQKRETSPNINIHAFVNSSSKKLEETNFFDWCSDREGSFRHRLTRLDTSLRVTNIQNIDPIVQGICSKLSRRYSIPMTCNMYVSPGGGIDCLGKHSDIQETFIFQLVGEKRWNIYQDEDGNDLRLCHEDVQRDGEGSHRTLVLRRGETLYTPSNLVHKVECVGDASSIHLNFALNLRNKREFCRFFFNMLEKEMGEVFDFGQPVDFRFLEAFCGGIGSVVSSLDVGRVREEYEKKQFMESVNLVKRGRVY